MLKTTLMLMMLASIASAQLCHIAATRLVPAKVVATKPAIVLAAFQPEQFVRNLFASVAPATASAFCPHQTFTERWRNWKMRHPHARAKFEDREPGHQIHFLSVAIDDMDGEPEPDPGGLGGCGCPPEVALKKDGCGWIHANIWY